MTLAAGTGFILNALVNLIKNITTMYLTLLIKQGGIMKEYYTIWMPNTNTYYYVGYASCLCMAHIKACNHLWYRKTGDVSLLRVMGE